MLMAHRARIERLLATQRALSIETLHACYLEHPLLAGMARRLIWQFDSRLGIWHQGRVIDDAERPIDLGAQKTARLWHPISSPIETILHWRCWLEDHAIRQPFNRLTAKCMWSRTPSGRQAHIPTVSPGTFCASTYSPLCAPSGVGGTG